MTTIASLFSSSTSLLTGFQTIKATELLLPTGRVVACDPLAYFNPQPFSRNCPPGRYPVYIHVLTSQNLIAYAELRLAQTEVASWEMAVVAGQDAGTLADHEIFGYPVSAGLGCFMDYSTVALLDQHDAELQAELGNDYISYYDDYVADLLEQPDSTLPDHCTLQPYAAPANNVAVFQSGYGDGFYATYVGLDQHRNPVKFVTEFIGATAH